MLRYVLCYVLSFVALNMYIMYTKWFMYEYADLSSSVTCSIKSFTLILKHDYAN